MSSTVLSVTKNMRKETHCFYFQGAQRKFRDAQNIGTSLVVQWLTPCSQCSMGLIPGRGTKIPHATRPKTKPNKQKTIEMTRIKQVS